MRKPRITINDYERTGGAEKLERDGHTREEISKRMYYETQGMNQGDRQKLMQKFYDRRGTRKYYG